MTNTGDTPLYNFLKEYASSGIVPFHMPGHKMGKGLSRILTDNPAALDITEVPGADNLHFPTGVVKQAQEFTAKAFGADRSFFLVNGSTCGIYAIISTICKPGDSLIVARDCHKSVIHGMMLAKVRPVFIMPEYNSRFGFTTGISAIKLKEILKDNKTAAGVLLTRPNYYGICSDIKEIAEAVHACGKVLAVDEAHGSHFKFNKRLPICAMDAGADICVQSAHKTLPAFTQGAYLHVGSQLVDMEKLEYYLTVYQTSSPSYMIMASLDTAREIMQKEGGRLLDGIISVIGENKACFSDKAITFADDTTVKNYAADPTRITANVGNLGITGYEAENVLRYDYGLQVEMADLYNLVCIATVADTAGTIGRLFSSLEKLCSSHASKQPAEIIQSCPELPEQKLDYHEAVQAAGEWTALPQSVNRISKGIVAPYPPGIPAVCPGEVISPAVAEYIGSILAAGGRVNGLNENLEINVVV